MDADWYEDPLHRYDGRFFDGEQWTDRVSSGGSLETDPDFPPADDGAEIQHEPPMRPAVEPVAPGATKRATTVHESPVRVVAVLDDSIRGASPAAAQQTSHRTSRGYVRWFLLAAAAAATILIIVLVTGRSNPAADSVAAADRVEDLESGGLTSDAEAADAETLDVDESSNTAPATENFGSAELVTVGSLRVLNGSSVLRDLEAWHRDHAADRGAELAAGAGCWFGQLAGTAVQVVQCGPVGVGSNNEPLFDLVPVSFDEVEGGRLAQPVVDDVTPDAVVANALILIGHPDGTPPPAEFSSTRGERAESDAN